MNGTSGKAKETGRLHKELGVLDVFAIAAGAMISSGLFVLPGLVYKNTGAATCLVYMIASVLVIPTLLCKAELATAMPKAGGDYFFIDRSLGPAMGTLTGFASWLSLGLKSAFALFGVGAFGLLLSPHLALWAVKLIGVLACLALTALNLYGVKHAGRFQVVLVMFLLTGLWIYGLHGLGHMNAENFKMFIPAGGWGRIWTATGMVFVSYGGLTKVASVAEEVRNPGRTIPLGMFYAYAIVTLLYVIVVLVTVGIMGDAMNGDLNPLVHGAYVSLGPAGAAMLSIAALLAYLTTGNAGIMAASRVPLAMSRDELVPESLANVHPHRGTPVRAILFTSLIMMVAIVALDLEILVKMASTMQLVLYLLGCAAVIMMRESRIENYRPQYHVPFYPYIPIAGILAYAFLIFEMGFLPLLLAAGFLGGALLWYAAYGRVRVNRESAIIRIVRRLGPAPLTGSMLDNELREILREREGIVEDRFDRLVRECPIMDMPGPMKLSEFFTEASRELGPHIDLEPAHIQQLLEEREAESSTILKPGMAVPHIVVEGEGRFYILLARVREGIIEGGDIPPVHAVFVLAGSRDLRNYHLKALMYIAQIVQDPDFEERWLKAANPDALRDLILLAKRTRDVEPVLIAD